MRARFVNETDDLRLTPTLEERQYLDDIVFERRAQVAEAFEQAQNAPGFPVERSGGPFVGHRPAANPCRIAPSGHFRSTGGTTTEEEK